MATFRNIIGPNIRKIRKEKKWTQAKLAMKCQMHGWSVIRDTIGKIESQARCVTDGEVMFLAKVLESSIEEIYAGTVEANLMHTLRNSDLND